VVSRNRTLLFKRPAKLFPVLNSVQPRVEEALLVPWHVGGKAVGTVWAISHDPDRHFDAEDGRLLRSLSRFASAGWQTISALDEADAARREIEGLLATLALGNLMARDLDGTIRFWSEGCTRLFGWTAAEATGRNAPDLLQTIYPALRAEIETALERNGEWTRRPGVNGQRPQGTAPRERGPARYGARVAY
jgi:PAS domain-containing protein